MKKEYFRDLFLMNWYEYCELLSKSNGGFIGKKGNVRLNESLLSDSFRKKLKSAFRLDNYGKSGINIFEESGAKIAYGGAVEDSYVHMIDENAKKLLKLNKIYTLKIAIPHEWVCYVELE